MELWKILMLVVAGVLLLAFIAMAIVFVCMVKSGKLKWGKINKDKFKKNMLICVPVLIIVAAILIAIQIFTSFMAILFLIPFIGVLSGIVIRNSQEN